MPRILSRNALSFNLSNTTLFVLVWSYYIALVPSECFRSSLVLMGLDSLRSIRSTFLTSSKQYR